MKSRSSNLDREIKKYLQSVRKAVNCSPASKAEVLEELKTDILLYTEENNVKDISEIVQRFGSPEKIAKSFLEESDVKTVNCSLKKRRRTATIVLLIALLIALVAIAIKTYNFYRREDYRNGHFVERITDKPLHSPEDASSQTLFID